MLPYDLDFSVVAVIISVYSYHPVEERILWSMDTGVLYGVACENGPEIIVNLDIPFIPKLSGQFQDSLLED